MSDRLRELTAFVRAGETGSFSRVARELGVSQPSISRMVADLEARLGVKLLLRTTRHVTLTDAGRVFLERARQILGELDDAENAARGLDSLRGTLRVALSGAFGIREVIPRLPGFTTQHPKLSIDLLMSDRTEDLIAEGADAQFLDRSIPVKKAYDDAFVAIYQNGERLMPGNGYPMRLLVPGYQGNMNVKFLRRIKLVDQPALSMYEARTYSQILPSGKAYRFYFLQEVKSFITHPSPGLALKGPGFYEISGVAYSGYGRIEKVMVSADGGKSWAQAALLLSPDLLR